MGALAMVAFALAFTAGCDESPSCREVRDEDSCAQRWDCSWDTGQKGRLQNNSCEFEPVGRCVRDRGGPAGCGSNACGGDLLGSVFYEFAGDGDVIMYQRCGGESPEGTLGCNLDMSDPNDPPECACACELYADEE